MRWRARLSAVPLNIVARLNQKASGMVSATALDQNGTIELISMWVAPFARGQGVGDALVIAVVEWARERAASKIALDVYETNERALALYRRHQFVEVEGISGGCSGLACERHMIRNL